MRRVLVITYYWPPSGGSGVQRWVKFSKYLPSLGWQPVVYTPENPEMPSTDMTLFGDIPNEAEIIKTRINEVYGIYRRLTGGKKGGGEVNPINSQKKTWKQNLAMALRGNLFIPDPRVSWVGPSVRFLKKYLAEHPVDVIVTTGPPHSMHLIGLRLSRATGIPWIADFRDPWTRMFYFKHLHLGSWALRRHYSLEKQVLDGATRIIAVSPLVRDEFMTMTDTPVDLITNGYDPEDFEQPLEPDGFFNITHTGLFAADGNPETLWQVLAEKCAEDAEFSRSMRIRLVGKTDTQITASIKAAGLGSNLVDLGYRDHNVAVREQMNASMLILPLRKEPEYRATLPGKLFEYLASLKPVLGIGQKDGAMAQVLSETKAGEIWDWDEKEGIRSFVDTCWMLYRTGSGWDRTENTEQYSRRSTAARLARLLDSLTQQ